jgi:TRAP-type C4-dicarboxylate transport system substrate-binding protein
LKKLFATILCWLGLIAFVHAEEGYTLKFATLAPQGSTWMNIISDWAKQVEKESQGRLRFKLYPGGVSGDEPDVLRKIRFGQLQGAAFTGHGIGHIYSPARIFEIPYLFRDAQEIDTVRAQFMPEIEAGFRKNDYELLGWMEVGFLRFFSKHPIRTLDDLKKSRIWLWQGDPVGIAFFNASGISPVPPLRRRWVRSRFSGLPKPLTCQRYRYPTASAACWWRVLSSRNCPPTCRHCY